MWKAIVFLLATAASVEALCDGCPTKNSRGNNPPYMLANMKEQTTGCQIGYSDNVSPATKKGLEAGTRAVENFLGKWGPCMAFVFEYEGTDANYQSLKTARSTWLTGLGVVASGEFGTYLHNTAFDDHVTRAKNGEMYAFVSGVTSCFASSSTCASCGTAQHPYRTGADAYFALRPDIPDTEAYQLAAHEYTHVYQVAHGYMANWLMEGGAVLMECVMKSLPGSVTDGVSSGGSYRACIKQNLGVHDENALVFPDTYNYGASPIKVLQGTAPTTGKTYLEEFGERRLQCETGGENCNERSDFLANGTTRAIYYDIGMLATAYAIHYAGKSMTDYWRGSNSFWKNIEAKDLLPDWNYKTSFQDTVPNDKGWKKALADWFGKGETSLAPFYESFDTWVRGITAPSDIDAILETDAIIATQAQTSASPSGVSLSSVSVACAAPPSGSERAVKTSMRVLSVSYSKLKQDAQKLKLFIAAVIDSVLAKVDGISKANVDVQLSEGSVLVDVTVTPPDDVVVADVVSSLTVSSDSSSFDKTLVANIQAIPAISTIATGTISANVVSAPVEITVDAEPEPEEISTKYSSAISDHRVRISIVAMIVFVRCLLW